MITSTSLLASAALAQTVNFDDAAPGAAPTGWTATKTGTGEAKWTIERDDSAPSKPNVLKQSGEATYPVCLKNGTSLENGFVEVKFKPISGKEDRAGGVGRKAGREHCPTMLFLKGESHMSEVFSIDTDDKTVSAPILAWDQKGQIVS